MFTYNELCIRVLEYKDLEKTRNLRNDPSTWEMLTFPGFINEIQQQKWFEKISMSNDTKYYVLSNDEYNFIGIVRTDEIDNINRSIRVGVDIVSNLRGKGFGNASYDLIKKYYFNCLNMNRIWLLVLETNIIAINLYKKQNFIEEGRHRSAVFKNGKYIDYIIMSILKKEYQG